MSDEDKIVLKEMAIKFLNWYDGPSNKFCSKRCPVHCASVGTSKKDCVNKISDWFEKIREV